MNEGYLTGLDGAPIGIETMYSRTNTIALRSSIATSSSRIGFLKWSFFRSSAAVIRLKLFS